MNIIGPENLKELLQPKKSEDEQLRADRELAEWRPLSIKLLQLSDKDLLLIAGKTLKTIKLQNSVTKILPPNNS